MSDQGAPCWYELATADPAASQAFYGPLLGWEFQDAGMPDFTYILALSGADMVAGLMQPDAPMPEFWMVYFAVDDCDAAAARVVDLGGGVHRPPEDIPGTGRFTIVTDPQGAAFGLLQPLSGGTGSAFDRSQNGHGNWHELHSTAPEAAPGEAALFARLAPGPAAARPWADLAQSLTLRARRGRAVNLDPAALLMDTLLRIDATAGQLAP